jgi:spore coat protein SA
LKQATNETAPQRTDLALPAGARGRFFHVLPEAERFSRSQGGAISRWVGYTVGGDPEAVVLCPESDGSWNFPPGRVRVLRRLAMPHEIAGKLGRRLPWSLRRHLLRAALGAGLRDLGPGDTVWIHNRPDFAAALTPYIRRRKARLVLHMHNSHIAKGYSRKILAEMSPDLTLFCSAFIEREALAHDPQLGSTAVLINGADDALFFPSAESAPSREGGSLTVLFVGRLVPDKGAHVLIEAMRLLSQRNLPVAAKIAGGPSPGRVLERYADDLRRTAPANVQFLGYVDPATLGEQFRAADIFCCPSTWDEPFGMTNVEAMATRLPVIASRCGGIPEVFSEGGALLVQPNSAEEIAAACEKLLNDPQLREQIAEDGYRSFKKNYTWHAVHREYRKVADAIEWQALE